MRQLRAGLARIKGLFQKAARERDLAAEIESHLQMHIDDNIRAGMSPQEAKRIAVMKLGGIDQTKEAYRDRATIPFLESLVQDLRFSLRQLRRHPTVTVAAVLTLSAAIGANTAIFSVVNAVLLRPLPYPNSDRVVNITTTSSLRGLDDLVLSEAEFNEFKNQNQSLEKMAAYASAALNLGDVAQPERIGYAEVSVDLFSALGVTAYLGRTFTPEEDVPGYEPRVLMSYRLWQGHYGSDPNIVGKTIQLNGRNRPVVGVMPQGFHFPQDDTDVWMQLNLDPASRVLNAKYLNTIALLKPGVSREQAESEINTVYQRVKKTYPQYYKNETGGGAAVVGLQEKNVKGIRRALLLLLGAVGFVLLIACANVANLLLARAAVRQKEMAVRSALGSGRWRIFRQLLTESVLLSIIGGALGLLLAFLILRVLLVGSPLDPRQVQSVRLDLTALGFTALVTLVVGVLFGLAPALRASKVDLNEELKQGGRGSMQGLRQNRTRTLLVISEVTLSMVLLIGAGLMIQSFLSLLKVDPGYDAPHILSMRLTVPGAKYPQNPNVTNFYQQLQDRISTIPGVQSAAIINQLPSDAEKSEASFEIEGRPFISDVDREDGIADFRMVSPSYFKTMGIPMMRGRTFTDQEGKQAPPAAIINDRLARRFFPGEDPTTRRIRLREDLPWLQIVGVIPDIKNQGLLAATTQEMYFPYVETSFGLPAAMRTMTVVIRANGEPASFSNRVRGELRAIDGNLPPYKVQTMEHVLSASVSKTRFTMQLLTAFSVLALILAAGGVYSVMAYSVSQRTREIGIRNALGAQRGDIFKLIMGQGFILATVGVVLGGIAGLALTRVMSNLLFTVSATDPKIFIGVALLLLVVALLACYLPARRAMMVKPIIALRNE
ncbi:MAG TPA: ABC transporter permease [Pyrinomonadaceae bacterium]|nr:ABC transporter permease [Pyrinomonadaceae bacterium]